MAILESQLSQQVIGSLAADILAPEPPVLGLIQAVQYVDAQTPKGKTRITLNWTAPTKNEFISGELFRNSDGTPSLADGTENSTHETKFDPVVSGSVSVYERTGSSNESKTLTASVSHGQRIINIGTPIPSVLIPGAKIVIDDNITLKEEYCTVKSVNSTTGDIILSDGLFESHNSGAFVKAVTLTEKTLGVHYNFDNQSGVLTELNGGFTQGNKIIIRYQTVLNDLNHYELYRVSGNAPIAIPTRSEVLAFPGVVPVSINIPANATSEQDQLLLEQDNGKDYTYYLFAVDNEGNSSSVTSEVMTDNMHLVFVELIPSIVQNLNTDVSSNKVVVSWDAVSDINSNGYNIYRSPGINFEPSQAVKLNSILIPKGSGKIYFEDSAQNTTTRRPVEEVPAPVNGQSYSYKIETEDTNTFWSDGTSNIPNADTIASKNTAHGDGTGGR